MNATRQRHVGVWLMLVIMAAQSLYSIPRRVALFSRMTPASTDWYWSYVNLIPLLLGFIYLVFIVPAWELGKNRRCLPSLSIQGTVSLAVALMAGTLLDYAGFQHFFPSAHPPYPLGKDFLRVMLICLGVGWLANIISGLEAAKEATAKKAKEASIALDEAKARLVASQMDPHVYYNILGNIRALMDFDNDGAKDMLDMAAAYTRRVMALSQKPMVPLGDEREMILEYLDLQRIRLGADRCNISWDWPASLDKIQLPPILIQPLVENAINHGIWPAPDGGALGISAHVDGTVLSVEVRNTGMPLDPKRPNSVGLNSIRQRLKLTYGTDAEFRLASDGAWTVAEIHLPVLYESSNR